MRRQIPALSRPLAHGRDGCAAAVRDGREGRATRWTCSGGVGGGRSWGKICRLGAGDPSRKMVGPGLQAQLPLGTELSLKGWQVQCCQVFLRFQDKLCVG